MKRLERAFHSFREGAQWLGSLVPDTSKLLNGFRDDNLDFLIAIIETPQSPTVIYNDPRVEYWRATGLKFGWEHLVRVRKCNNTEAREKIKQLSFPDNLHKWLFWICLPMS